MVELVVKIFDLIFEVELKVGSVLDVVVEFIFFLILVVEEVKVEEVKVEVLECKFFIILCFWYFMG